jgi:endo-alpha-1,4-polygalactosaminidase (GH114 family)
MEFRVGDLVEVFCEDGDCNLDRVEQGMVGTVIQNNSDGTVLVSFEGFDGHTTDEMDAWWVWKRHLRPATTIEKSKKGDDGMTEIEKLSRKALADIYEIVGLGGDDDVDDVKAIESIIARYNSDVEQIKIEEELTKRPFQVGDIITGIEGHHYAYTTEDAIMQVVEVFPNEEIRVKILRHKLRPDLEGEEFDVDEKYFREVE